MALLFHVPDSPSSRPPSTAFVSVETFIPSPCVLCGDHGDRTCPGNRQAAKRLAPRYPPPMLYLFHLMSSLTCPSNKVPPHQYAHPTPPAV